MELKLAAIMEILYRTSIKIIKNEIGCRDDTMLKTVDTIRHCEEGESMQQSSATPKNQRCRDWVVAYSHSSSQCLLVSTVFGMVSLMIFILVSPYVLCRLSLDCSARRDDVVLTYAHAYCTRESKRKL